MCKTEIEYARAEIGWIFGWKHVHSSLSCPPFSFSAVSLLYFPPTLSLFDRHNLFVPPGNYSCMPTNAEGTSAIVHVINGKWTRVCDSGLLLASLFSLSVNPFFRLIFMELGVVIAFIIPFFPLCFVRCVSVCALLVKQPKWHTLDNFQLDLFFFILPLWYAVMRVHVSLATRSFLVLFWGNHKKKRNEFLRVSSFELLVGVFPCLSNGWGVDIMF